MSWRNTTNLHSNLQYSHKEWYEELTTVSVKLRNSETVQHSLILQHDPNVELYHTITSAWILWFTFSGNTAYRMFNAYRSKSILFRVQREDWQNQWNNKRKWSHSHSDTLMVTAHTDDDLGNRTNLTLSYHCVIFPNYRGYYEKIRITMQQSTEECLGSCTCMRHWSLIICNIEFLNTLLWCISSYNVHVGGQNEGRKSHCSLC